METQFREFVKQFDTLRDRYFMGLLRYFYSSDCFEFWDYNGDDTHLSGKHWFEVCVDTFNASLLNQRAHPNCSDL